MSGLCSTHRAGYEPSCEQCNFHPFNFERHPIKFELDETQIKVANEWMKEQKAKFPARPSMCGERFQYRFTPSSIGTGTSIYDFETNEEKSLDDHIKW